MSVCVYEMLLVHNLYAGMQLYNIVNLWISATMNMPHLVMLT